MAVDDGYTVVLLHFTGVDGGTTFTDESGKIWTPAGEAQLDSSEYKFTPTSGLFDGTGDWITTPDHADFNFGAGAFSIDFWVRFNDSVPAERYFCGHSIDGSNYILFRLFGGELNFVCETNPGGYMINISRAHTMVVDTWYHLAFTFDGTDGRLFVNGTQLGAAETAAGSMINGTGVFAVGSAEYGGSFLSPLNGWIDEFRISKGIARWTANFTPSSSPYAPNPNIELDFDTSPLTIPVALSAEAMFLDFYSTALYSTISIIFGTVELNMDEAPLVLIPSMALDEPTAGTVYMETAPLAAVLSISDEFEARGGNFIIADLPVSTMVSVLTERSLSIDADFPAMDMWASLLVGETLNIDADIPAMSMTASLLVGVSVTAAFDLPSPTMQSYLLVGQNLVSTITLPVLSMVSNLLLIPTLTMSTSIPALIMGSSVSIIPGSAIYRGVAINLQTMAVTEYRDFNFNSLCKFNEVYLGANETGIYVISGDTDSGADVAWNFKTPKLDLLNKIPKDIWMFMRNKNAITVEVVQGEDTEETYTYDINLDMDPLLHMERLKLGRGLNYREMQLKFAGTGELDLNKIEFIINPVKKTKR